MPVCFNYGRETPVKLYGDPEIHACHRVSQHYSFQSEVVVVVVVVLVVMHDDYHYHYHFIGLTAHQVYSYI